MGLASKRASVREVLETAYGIDINTAEKITRNSFRPGQLPKWFLYSKSIEEIAQLVYVSSQILNADVDYLTVTGDDGKEITYFINIGRDVPGMLCRILEENRHIALSAFDSVKIGSGRRIVTLEKEGRKPFVLEDAEDLAAVKELERDVCREFENLDSSDGRVFLESLPPNYLLEEVNSEIDTGRLYRHMRLYHSVISGGEPVYTTDETSSDRSGKNREHRISIAVPNPGRSFTLRVLELIRDRSLNLTRTFWDIFGEGSDNRIVGILSVYFDIKTDITGFLKDLDALFSVMKEAAAERHSESVSEWERLVRGLSSPRLPDAERDVLMQKLRFMVERNTDASIPGDKYAGNLALNAFCGFFDAAKAVGLENADAVLLKLLAFERFDEFWVETVRNGEIQNAEGFRVKHSTVRGPAKGGIRNDLIVDFAEVSGLSFLMTWKCARTGILYGGGKGGLKIAPREYASNRIELFDTLSNFGRALFLVTGPSIDVPAGDVGCGPEEIGQMFEGFKSALHDLALMAYGIKQSGAILGHRVISMEQARSILKYSFDIDAYNEELMEELSSNEKYLELVAAAHITGKPEMGLAARNGATGRGLCYALLAAVANEYAAGRWEAGESLSAREGALVEELTALRAGGAAPELWEKLHPVFCKLLKGKKVVVQGSGKVGSSFIADLAPYGVIFTSVADHGGAVFGESLDAAEILDLAKSAGTVIGAQNGVVKKITGAREGAAALGEKCDILVLAALENAITMDNAPGVKASLVVCGSNGPITPKAEAYLHERDITVLYDFLANSGGVTASYFEWLRNLSDRLKYETEVLRKKEYKPEIMAPYVMPEYAQRIFSILGRPEGPEITSEWNMIIRDIMITAVNTDYAHSRQWQVPMKTAGFAHSLLKVLSARIMKADAEERAAIWKDVPEKTREALKPFFEHPESKLYNACAEDVILTLE